MSSRVLTYGAAFVSRRILRFLRSCASGRRCRCFSKEFRRSMGEMGVSSGLRTGASLSVTAEDILMKGSGQLDRFEQQISVLNRDCTWIEKSEVARFLVMRHAKQ